MRATADEAARRAAIIASRLRRRASQHGRAKASHTASEMPTHFPRYAFERRLLRRHAYIDFDLFHAAMDAITSPHAT